MKYVMDGFGTPGVLTMHPTEYGRDGNVFYDGFARRVRDAERAGCHTATAVIAVSHFLADELRRFYQVPNEKLHAVPNGVSYDAFDGFIDSGEVKGSYGIAPSASTIFALGRMTVQKGMDMLVEAVPMVLASYPETRAASPTRRRKSSSATCSSLLPIGRGVSMPRRRNGDG